MQKDKNTNKGFTLIEMLVVIGLIALLSTVVLVAVNPSRQFKSARDSARSAHLATILNAIGQNMSENKGVLMCGGVNTSLPATSTEITSEGTGFDLAPCIVPVYLSSMPFDPSGEYYFNNTTNYESGYSISQDGNYHITLTAQSELNPENLISATR